MKKSKADLKKECGPFSGTGKFVVDNFADVYIGDCKKIKGKKVTSHHEHSKAKSFKFRGECCDYLYFVCWSDDAGRNGLLVELHGDSTVFSGASNWEVFATGINKDKGSIVTINEVNTALARACKDGWQKPFVGQQNDGSNKPFPAIGSVDKNANFIWHDSGKSSGTYAPFKPGFNHDEFLIFRLPLSAVFTKRCAACECEECCEKGERVGNCGCDGCNKNAKQYNQELLQRAQVKAKTLGQSGCPANPFEGFECKSAFGKLQNIQPCVYLHWGDSPRDIIENHDTEILYITVCNPFIDVELKGFQITKISLVPTPTQKHQARIIPDRFIDYGCLEPCTCKTREFTLLTRDELNQYTGTKQVEIEYCWEETVLTAEIKVSGKASFPISIIKDED